MSALDSHHRPLRAEGHRRKRSPQTTAAPLGSSTSGPEFVAAFGWPDVIPVAYDEHDAAGVLADLSSQPDRLAAVRTQNIRNSRRRHDGSAGWSQVPDASRLPLTPPLQKRIVPPRARAGTVDLSGDGSTMPHADQEPIG